MKSIKTEIAKTKRWKLPIFIIAILSLLCFVGFDIPEDVSAQQGREHYLFLDSGAELQSFDSSDINCPFMAMASDSRFVSLNELLLEPGNVETGDLLVMDIGDGKSETAVIDRVNSDINGVFSLRGRLINDKLGYVIISGKEGKFMASIKNYREDKHYLISFNKSTGNHILHLLNREQSDFLPGTNPMYFAEEIIIPQLDILPQSLPEVEEEVTVDIMIVYTPAAKNYAAETTGIDSFISKAMELSQLALDNSNTEVNLRLVHSTKVNYSESGSITTDLRRLTNTTSFITEVHELRDRYGADLVNMFTLEHKSGGHAWILNNTSGDPSRGFSITRVQQASWTYTMVHELAHNFGCHHSKYQSVEPGPGIFSYSAGWRWTGDDDDKYASVMAYSEGTYNILPYFSNPDILYAGVPTGDTMHGDNARTLRQLKPVIAGYRKAVKDAPELMADFDDAVDNEVEIYFEDDPVWRDSISRITVDEVEILADNYSVNEGMLTISSVIFQEAGDYHIRVIAEGYMDARITKIITSSEDPIKYTVTFRDWDDDIIHTDIVAHGTAAKAPSDPTREGYTFTGWDKDFSNVTENITVTALYLINHYILSYNAGTGGSITGQATQRVSHGADGTEVEAVPDIGYHFTSWDDSLTTATRTEINVTDNHELTANFAPNTYMVTFEDWDGSILQHNEVEHDGAAEAPDDPKREGYAFTGWDKDFSSVTTDLTVTATYLIKTAVPVITTEEQTLSTATASIKGTAEPNAHITVTGGATEAFDQTDAEGNFRIEVTLTPDTVNMLSLTAQVTGKTASEAVTVAITHNPLMGDVDGDSNITITDAIMILRHLVGLIELDSDQLTRAKVSGGEELKVTDAIMILRYIVGIIQEF